MQIKDPQARAALESVVTEFVAQQRVFTAAHVTVEVRKRKTPAGTLPHRGVLAPAIRALFQEGSMPGYTRIPVPGSVFAYCPASQSPSGVDLTISSQDWLPPLRPSEVAPEPQSAPQSGYPTQVVKTAPVAPQPSQKTIPVSQGPKYLRAVENGTTVTRKWREGRFVEVPREMLRKMKFHEGTMISLIPIEGTDSPEVSLVPGDFSEQTAHVQQSRQVLRLGRALLEPLGFTTSKPVAFIFEVPSNGEPTLTLSQ